MSHHAPPARCRRVGSGSIALLLALAHASVVHGQTSSSSSTRPTSSLVQATPITRLSHVVLSEPNPSKFVDDDSITSASSDSVQVTAVASPLVVVADSSYPGMTPSPAQATLSTMEEEAATIVVPSFSIVTPMFIMTIQIIVLVVIHS